VDVHELAPALRYWVAPHPAWRPDDNWSEDVLCVYYEAPDALVLFDPLVPRGEEDEFWRALDRDVERLGMPVRVLLTAPWHDRDTTLVVERYGADVWAHPEALWKGPVLTTTQDLPAGIEAFLPEGNEEGQAFFFIGQHQTLVTGDMFSGTGGVFHVFVSPDEPNPAAFIASLHDLLELPIERVLIAQRRAGAEGRPRANPRGARIRLTTVR
jgi:glyoxylase-like metal-dependent hydrolase (beta-lactamase superfamily II)